MLRAQLNLFPSDEIRQRQIAERSLDRSRVLSALEQEGLLPPGVGVDPAGVPEMTADLTAAVHAWVARTPAKAMLVQPEDILGRPEQANLRGRRKNTPTGGGSFLPISKTGPTIPACSEPRRPFAGNVPEPDPASRPRWSPF